jgi:hypothetical protein
MTPIGISVSAWGLVIYFDTVAVNTYLLALSLKNIFRIYKILACKLEVQGND